MATNTATKGDNEKRTNGVYYTPKILAEYLAEPLLTEKNLTVFDPAYGEGALLLAAKNVYQKLFGSNSENVAFFGCDRSPVNGKLTDLQNANLVESDFFQYPVENKFDVILLNPPYVRHHTLGCGQIERFQKAIFGTIRLSSKADLWTYFLIKSTQHLKEGGRIGAILPWSFLQADYARDLRKWLTTVFGEIRVLALGAEYFENAEERVVLVWLEHYGKDCGAIKMTSAKRAGHEVFFHDVSLAQWTSDRVVFNANHDIDSLLSRYVSEFAFSRFEEFADIRIGVVTGADKYFIIAVEMAEDLRFCEADLIEILTTSRELFGFSMNGTETTKRLLSFAPSNSNLYTDYIKSGEKKKYNKRAHSLRRSPWYCVDTGRVPDAFFPYRMAKLPYLVRNNGRIQCTNSIHRIYFKDISETEIKWIQVAMLSDIGQLSIERYSKTYGKGMLKIEPKSLKNTVVYASRENSINAVHNEIHELLLKQDKKGAANLATKFVNEKLNIPTELSLAVSEALEELQSRRLNR